MTLFPKNRKSCYGHLVWKKRYLFKNKSISVNYYKDFSAQIISGSAAPVKEIDTINALILGDKTISHITTLMCAHNPDCSSEPSLEPITICAEQALQKVRA